MTDQAVEVVPGRLVVLTGPSGVGKGSVMAAVRRDHPGIWLSVSATTRRPRPGEVHGKHYFFLTDAQFDQMIEHGDLLEWASFAGNRYGTPKSPVFDHIKAGNSALLEIELDGARQIRRSNPEAFQVFLAPPSIEELRRRLVGRATEDPAAIAARLRQADIEMSAQDEFDATVINDVVDRAAAELVGLLVGPRDQSPA